MLTRLCRRAAAALCSKPITLHLFFAGTDAEFEAAHELVMDIPGGGFICMNPMHHEERLLRWAIRTKKVVVSFDYGKVSFRCRLKLI